MVMHSLGVEVWVVKIKERKKGDEGEWRALVKTIIRRPCIE